MSSEPQSQAHVLRQAGYDPTEPVRSEPEPPQVLTIRVEPSKPKPPPPQPFGRPWSSLLDKVLNSTEALTPEEEARLDSIRRRRRP